MTFLRIFNLCLLTVDLIGWVWLMIWIRKSKRNIKHTKELSESFNRIIKSRDEIITRKNKEINDYMTLCYGGQNQLKVESAPFCYQLVAERNDKKFVIKEFFYNNWNDKEEVDFCRRQAEELKEIIEKF